HQNLGAELALLSSEHRAARLTCLTTVMFENSRGCLSACLGDYAHALEAFVMGYESAKMVGNEMFMGINAANAAVAVGRLGRYSEALSWNRRSASCFATLKSGWREERALLWSAWCLAMLGQHRAATDLVEKLFTAWEVHESEWVRQYNVLMTADI